LHVYLLTERLTTPLPSQPTLLSSPGAFSALKQSQVILNAHRFPKAFLYHLYESFHSHLPEELFYEDFVLALRRACRQSAKGMAEGFEKADGC